MGMSGNCLELTVIGPWEVERDWRDVRVIIPEVFLENKKNGHGGFAICASGEIEVLLFLKGKKAKMT